MAQLWRTRLAKKTVKKFISDRKPVSLSGSQTVADAVKLMRKHEIGAVLVMEDTALIGIFTETDADRLLHKKKKNKKRKLEEVMMTAPETISKSTSVSKALKIMTRGGFRHLPVMEKDRVIGVVSRRDFFKYDEE
jgi:CBS domain-containing protein